MQKTNIFFIFSVFLLAFGCMERNPSKLEFVETNNLVRDNQLIRGEAPLSYESLKKYILKPKCMSCHSGPDAKPVNDPIDFSTYEKAMIDRFVPLLVKGKPQISRLFLSVKSGDMPIEGSLQQEEIDFIKKWIEACAPKDELQQIPSECPTSDEDDEDDDDWDDDWGDDDEEPTAVIGLANIQNVKDAVSASVKSFIASQSNDGSQSLLSIESVLKADGVTVNISLANQIKSYSCHRHEDSDPYECHLTGNK